MISNLTILDPNIFENLEAPNGKVSFESDKLKIWFGKETKTEASPEKDLEIDKKAFLLAKLRELDDGWEETQKVSNFFLHL